MPKPPNDVSYPVREDEVERLESLEDYDILDTPRDEAYDNLTQLAAQFFDVPIAFISLLDQDRQWFKSVYGMETRETNRSCAFCNYTMVHDSTFVVEDALDDDRFQGNPLVEKDPNIRFYAGHPLYGKDDLPLGTFCLIDRTPRSFSSSDEENLRHFSQQAESLLDMHLREQQLARRNRELEETQQELNETLQYKDSLLNEVHHRIKNNLQSISSFLRLQSREMDQDPAQSAISESEQRVRTISLIHERLHVDGAHTELEFDDYVRDLLSSIYQAHSEQAKHVRRDLNVDALELDVELVVSLGLFITEAVMNALQHAFGDGSSGTITVEFHERGDDYRLEIADDGKGFEPGDDGIEDSFGLRLLKTLGTGQLSGELSIRESQGTQIVLTFPGKGTS
jgi:two-component sensor histidine kinase